MDESRPPTTPGPVAPVHDPASRVTGPAVGLIVTSIIGMVVAIFGLVVNGLNVSTSSTRTSTQDQFYVELAGGMAGIASGVVGFIVGIVILIGAVKMKHLQSYVFAFTVCILAMVPCVSPCCVLGLPFGIWGLVVLSDPAVKEAFQ